MRRDPGRWHVKERIQGMLLKVERRLPKGQGGSGKEKDLGEKFPRGRRWSREGGLRGRRGGDPGKIVQGRRSREAGACKEIIWEQQLEGEREPGQGLPWEGDGPGEIRGVEMSQGSLAKGEDGGPEEKEQGMRNIKWGSGEGTE